MPRRHVYSHVYGPAARLGWFLLYVAVLMVPLVLTWTVPRSPGTERGEALVLSAGLIAFSALVVAVVLPARLPMLPASASPHCSACSGRSPTGAIAVAIG
jgi:3-phenylpropionate/trans-cinnamate dioxygenase ferredoxin reductase subunit